MPFAVTGFLNSAILMPAAITPFMLPSTCFARTTTRSESQAHEQQAAPATTTPYLRASGCHRDQQRLSSTDLQGEGTGVLGDHEVGQVDGICHAAVDQQRPEKAWFGMQHLHDLQDSDGVQQSRIR